MKGLRAAHAAVYFQGGAFYQVNGDLAQLRADVCIADDDLARTHDWELQLWACDPGIDPLDADGVKVAELRLDASNVRAGEVYTLDGWTAAHPPAGTSDCTMVMTLSEGEPGREPVLHDIAVFPNLERFIQPKLAGKVACHFESGDVVLEVGRITNPRAADNLSGTLALELWALPADYHGGAFEGVLLARAEIAPLAGQQECVDLRLRIPGNELPADAQRLTLMLREWTSIGFLTRDYAGVVATRTIPAEKAPVEEAKPVAAERQVPSVAAKLAEQATPVVPETARREAANAAVSINRASAEELAAIKGLGKAAIQGIIAARPYSSVEEVVRAKGMGPKLLAKLRRMFKV